MRKPNVQIATATVFLLAAAFVCGFMVPDVLASGARPDEFFERLSQLPHRLESMVRSSPADEVRSLPLIATYSSLMERLQADYYGRVDKTKLTYEAIRGVLRALDDPFTRFLDPEEFKKMQEENEGNFSGIGALLDTNKKGEVYIKEPYPDTPAERAGIKKNDVIIAVNDQPIAGLDIEEVVSKIRGDAGTKVKLTMQRPGRPKPINFTVTRGIVQFRMAESRMLDEKNGIGYIRLHQFNEKSDKQFDEAMSKLEKHDLRALILDLRGNPGGLLEVAVDIGSRFLKDGNVVIIQERGGQRVWRKVKEEKHNHKLYPLVVLVDKTSASASEIVSGAIKDAKIGTLVGVTTFGKGRVQTIIPLQPDGSAVLITTAKYFTPNGTDIHEKGIEPDFVVEQPDIEEILEAEGKKSTDELDLDDPKYDVQLSKAVEVAKVKLGILPESVLTDLKKSAKVGREKQQAQPSLHGLKATDRETPVGPIR